MGKKENSGQENGNAGIDGIAYMCVNSRGGKLVAVDIVCDFTLENRRNPDLSAQQHLNTPCN